MDGGGSGGHGDVDGWNPHVALANGLADVGKGVRDTVVAPGNVLAVHLVIFEVHVGATGGFVCTDHDGVGDHVVANHTGWTLGCRFVRWGREHLVDDVDDAVAGNDVGRSDGGVVDRHRTVDHGKGRIVSVQHGGDESVGHACCVDSALQDVVGEDVHEGGVGLVGVEVCKVNTGFSEGGVGGRKDREGSVALQGFNQTGVRQGGHEGFVRAGRCSVGGDVLCFISRDTERNGRKAEAGNHEERYRTVHGACATRAILKSRYFSCRQSHKC